MLGNQPLWDEIIERQNEGEGARLVSAARATEGFRGEDPAYRALFGWVRRTVLQNKNMDHKDFTKEVKARWDALKLSENSSVTDCDHL